MGGFSSKKRLVSNMGKDNREGKYILFYVFLNDTSLIVDGLLGLLGKRFSVDFG